MRHKAVKYFEREVLLCSQLVRVSQEKNAALAEVQAQKQVVRIRLKHTVRVLLRRYPPGAAVSVTANIYRPYRRLTHFSFSFRSRR